MSPRPPDELCTCKHPKAEHVETFPIAARMAFLDYGKCNVEDCKCTSYESMIKY